jgi:hypothetical protein
MFGWFGPRCPVSAEDKVWAEERLRWLAAHFGLERLRSAAVVLPTPEFFPEPYGGTEADGRVVFERVCRRLKLDPGSVPMEFFAEDRAPPWLGEGRHEGAAGLYENAGWARRIQIERSALSDPVILIATAAHELAHLLLGGSSFAEGDEDHEKLTDLATVALGLGVFTANSRVREFRWSDRVAEGGGLRRLGYLGQPQVGYALALYAHVRGEESPAWAGHLCLDVRSPFWAGLRYLRKHGCPVYDE